MSNPRSQHSNNTASSSSATFPSTSPFSKSRSSGRTRKLASSRLQSPFNNSYPQGPPLTTEEKLFSTLNGTCVSARPLVAADDILVPLFDDIRNGLRVRRIGNRRLSPQDSRLLRETFGTAMSTKLDPDYAVWQAQSFTERMVAHGIVAAAGDDATAFSNLALRYSRLKQSPLVRVSHARMNDGIEARILAKTHIPRRFLLLELGGTMSADAIEDPMDTKCHTIRIHKRKVSSQPTFAMFSVIWKANDQYGPGPRKDRLLVGPARFINHSCRPNCKLVPHPRTNGWSVQTLKDIEEGEELTISYGDHYFEPGECICTWCVAGLNSFNRTPATSVGSSPAPPSPMESQTSGKLHNKRRRPDSDVDLDDMRRPTKKTRR